MIIGLGNDIVDVRRIEKTLAKSHGETFKERVFTKHEIDYCGKMAASAPHFAARWAFKEAFYKALPEELQQLSHWRAVELVRNGSAKPAAVICDPVLAEEFRIRSITVHHSISHERNYCTAVVVLEQKNVS